jgi:polyphenol oxidase
MTERISLSPIISPALNDNGIAHGFFTRHGGVSSGIYQGLNVGIGSSDERALVEENRRRAALHLGAAPERLINPWQVHSPDAVIVSSPFEGERPKADGIVTATPGLAIAVVTADCGPILFSDAKAGVIGAAHAGWKGAIGGVLENTIAAMETLGAKRADIKAVLGPSISQANYEVGPEFVASFLSASKENMRWFEPSVNAGHSMFDLWGYTLSRLGAAGVDASCVSRCTYADETSFYSYRRATHRQEPDYGRQLSAIMLKG